ncbi:MAG: rRNA maturation RNase YbeY [Lachnospiraceae bacterium]|nr:rRNA maturation RNase YbeY [Lachnospiraceae bacterium]
MTSYVETEADLTIEFDFDIKEITDLVMNKILDMEKCPYEAAINLLLTDNETIQEYNRQHRDMDNPTDVLSFPNVYFDTPGDFNYAEEKEYDCFDPDSGELILGDIIISAEKVREQAKSYGHSEKREFAFLVAHSMLHLCGYDHMTEQEAVVMEQKQDNALNALGITRD